LGLAFSYYTLVPAALNFFLSYSEEVLEPFGLLINILNLSWYYFTAPD
jgi:Sec-independent protein secretion pathway component TatC